MCVLHIRNNEISFKKFAASTAVPYYQVKDKGEKLSAKSSKIFSDYLLSCDVSKKKWTDVKGQIEDMILFLEKHSAEIEKLKSQISKLDMRFDIPIESRLGKKIAVQVDYLPANLLLMCGQLDIAIELSYYPAKKK